MKNKFEFLEHTADIKFKAYGKNLKEAFENSASALLNTIYDKKIKSLKRKKITVSGTDLQNLLYNFLEEFLFLIDSEGFLASEINIQKFDEKKLKIEAELSGDDSKGYKTDGVKAITYHDMSIKHDGEKFVIQAVVDV